ncbi:acyl-CoA carboxylase epsilon subunit [Streptomyces sp. NPDC088762]|uniref:acyl-CoA carboxylase epsilon subunit n=1 Tax=Streptomyces sp. NPDC088762 TaxID=3365891 RepID=UPI0038090427
MTAGDAAHAPQTWRILGGDPDEDETAAVLAVLTALLLNRSAARAPEPPRTAAAGWDRVPAGGFRPAGSWRQR